MAQIVPVTGTETAGLVDVAWSIVDMDIAEVEAAVTAPKQVILQILDY